VSYAGLTVLLGGSLKRTVIGDMEHPTSEFPEYRKGQATAQESRPDPQFDDDESAPEEPRARRGRALFFLAGAVGLIVVLVLSVQAVGLWPSWRNPFTEETKDRSQPPLLQSIQDLSRYVAAEGNFQVVIDLERDRKYVPDFLLNQRTLFVGAGRVDAYVDFGKIGDGAIVESADRTSAEITLPAPQLTEASLDLEKSYVFAEERGLLNRLGEVFGGDPNRQQEVYRLAQERITGAARDSGLALRAEENTRKMLEGLLRSLGYTQVKVTYTAA
jgi:hypothetical protein